MIKLTALWKNEKEGKEYYSGYLGDTRILVFPNGYKTEDKHPDFIVYVAENKRAEDPQPDTPAPKNTDGLPF